MKRISTKGSACCYCGSTIDITKDHVPPRQIFAEPISSITVPCCSKCNQSFQKDDEYFRIYLIMYEKLENYPEIRKIKEDTLRGLTRPKKIAFLKAIYNKLGKVNIMSPSGIYIQTKPAFNVDEQRLCRFISRIVRGLFYHKTGLRIPDDFGIRTLSEFALKRISKENPDMFNNQILPIMKSLYLQPSNNVGKIAFTYKVYFDHDNTNLSAWLLTFYNHIIFLCIIARKEEN